MASFLGFDPVLINPQQGNPGGNSPPPSSATGSIGNVEYTAVQPGTDGNLITITHQEAETYPAIKAEATIANMTYRARTAGISGNGISLTHQPVYSIPAVSASRTISGMTYTADTAGAAGNNISVELTQGSAGSAGTAILTRNMTSGTASFNITEKSGYYGSPTTVKFTSSAIQTPVAQLPASASDGDGYFNYNTILIRAGQNSSGYSQNHQFLDSSSNAFSVVGGGSSGINSYQPQGSFSPYSKGEGYWSNYFDGSGDSSTVPDNDAFWFTGDFTVEAWIFPTAMVAQTIVAHWLTGSAGACSFALSLTASNALRFSYGIGLSNVGIESATGAVTANQWSHVAVSRAGTSVKVFLNGQVVASTTASGSLNNCTNSLTIGRTTTDYFYGYISNLRIVKGTAVYTAAFSPATAPLATIAGTSLLTCQSNRFVDKSTNNLAISTAGNTETSTFGPFSASAYSPESKGGSAYFYGTTPMMVNQPSSAFDFGTGDLTVEAWVWWDGTYDSNGRIIYSTGAAGSLNQLGIFNSTALAPSGGIWFGNVAASGVFPKANSWNHIAATRSGSTIRIFLNGDVVGTGTNSSAIGSSVSIPYVGGRSDGFHPWKGYIGELRIVKGTAVYTAAFTPPSAPLANIAGTSLLLRFANASVCDMSNTVTVDLINNTSSSSTVTKFAGKSLAIPQSNYNYVNLGTTAHHALSLGTAPFTIEAWVYPTSPLTNYATIYSSFGGARTGAYLLRFLNTGKLSFYIYPLGEAIVSTSTISIGTWTHVAVSRSGGTLRMYINGVLEASLANTTNLVSDPFHPAMLGGYWKSSSTDPAVGLETTGFFDGFIEDFRLTKGYGRYFSPSSITRTLSGSTELIRFPTGSTVAQVLAVVGPSGTNQSSRVSISSSSSGTLSATEPSPNNGVTTSGGTAAQSLLVSTSGNDITVRISGTGSTNAEIKSAIEASASAAALVNLSSPTGSASATAKTFLTGGADLVPASLGSSLVGSAITVSVPDGTTNSALKTYLESVNEIAGGGGIIDLFDPSGNAPTSSGPINLAGGSDEVAGSFNASVSGTDISVTVPAGMTGNDLAANLNADAGVASLVSAGSSDSGPAQTAGSVTLSGGI